MPQPMHSSSDINAILSAGATSIHSFPAKYDIFLNIFNYTWNGKACEIINSGLPLFLVVRCIVVKSVKMRAAAWRSG